jgi:stage II sporulation SpoAA-like protein
VGSSRSSEAGNDVLASEGAEERFSSGAAAMIHFELLRDRNILIVTPQGPLEKADFERLASEIDPIIASQGKLAGIMISIQSFPGWQSFEALVSHLKFIANHQRNIDRIAVVTDSGFLKLMPHIAGLFVHPKLKHFDLAQKDQALAWLETGG